MGHRLTKFYNYNLLPFSENYIKIVSLKEDIYDINSRATFNTGILIRKMSTRESESLILRIRGLDQGAKNHIIFKNFFI